MRLRHSNWLTSKGCISIAASAVVWLSVSCITSSFVSAASGSFSGRAQPTNCRSSKPLPFTGQISGNRIVLRAKDVRMTGSIQSGGRFSIRGRLRKHRLGTKMQFWSGNVKGNRLTYAVRFGVPGYPQTFCSASGEAVLR